MPESLRDSSGLSNPMGASLLDIETRLTARSSALGGAVGAIARRTHKSEATIYKTIDGAICGPWIEAARWLAGAREGRVPDPFAPLRVLAESFGFRLAVSLPVADCTKEGLSRLGLSTVREATEAAEAAIEADDVTFEREMRQAREHLDRLEASRKQSRIRRAS